MTYTRTLLGVLEAYFPQMTPFVVLSPKIIGNCNSALVYQILWKLDDRRQSYDVILIFTRWWTWRRKLTSSFRFGHVWHLGRFNAIGVPNFDQISQSTAEILLLPVFENTAAILKFYFLFRFWPFHCHRQVILHWRTKFYANRMIADGVMTSYWF